MSTSARDASSPRESSGKRLLSILIVWLLVVVPVWPPMEAQILKTGGEGAPQKLFINILEGEGALNNIRQRDAREPVVQVTDENHKPVAGAAVLFLIHNGPHATATFGGSQSVTVTTGPDGIAHAAGLQLGTAPGSFTISVTATFSVAAAAAGAAAVTLTATAIIHQANVITALSSSTAGSSSAGSSASGGTSGGSSAGGSSASGGSAGSSSSSAGSAGGTSAGGSSSSTGAAGGSTAGGSAGSTTGTVASHGILHLSHTALIVAGTVAVAAAVATVVAVTQNGSSTSVTLGSSTVGHP